MPRILAAPFNFMSCLWIPSLEGIDNYGVHTSSLTDSVRRWKQLPLAVDTVSIPLRKPANGAAVRVLDFGQIVPSPMNFSEPRDNRNEKSKHTHIPIPMLTI
jgi:hypothetical protein